MFQPIDIIYSLHPMNSASHLLPWEFPFPLVKPAYASFGNSAFLVGNRLTLLLGSLWTNLAIPLSTPSFRTHLDDRAAFWPLRRPSLVPTLYFIPFTLYPLLPLSVRHWMLVRIQFAIRSMFVRHWMFVARTHTQFASEVGAPSQRTNDNTDLIH